MRTCTGLLRCLLLPPLVGMGIGTLPDKLNTPPSHAAWACMGVRSVAQRCPWSAVQRAVQTWTSSQHFHRRTKPIVFVPKAEWGYRALDGLRSRDAVGLKPGTILCKVMPWSTQPMYGVDTARSEAAAVQRLRTQTDVLSWGLTCPWLHRRPSMKADPGSAWSLRAPGDGRTSGAVLAMMTAALPSIYARG